MPQLGAGCNGSRSAGLDFIVAFAAASSIIVSVFREVFFQIAQSFAQIIDLNLQVSDLRRWIGADLDHHLLPAQCGLVVTPSTRDLFIKSSGGTLLGTGSHGQNNAVSPARFYQTEEADRPATLQDVGRRQDTFDGHRGSRNLARGNRDTAPNSTVRGTEEIHLFDKPIIVVPVDQLDKHVEVC